MMHPRTWRKWLLEISPIRFHAECVKCGHEHNGVCSCGCLTRMGSNVDAMAEALCLAAPQGPAGILCIDPDCEEHTK